MNFQDLFIPSLQAGRPPLDNILDPVIVRAEKPRWLKAHERFLEKRNMREEVKNEMRMFPIGSVDAAKERFYNRRDKFAGKEIAKELQKSIHDGNFADMWFNELTPKDKEAVLTGAPNSRAAREGRRLSGESYAENFRFFRNINTSDAAIDVEGYLNPFMAAADAAQFSRESFDKGETLKGIAGLGLLGASLLPVAVPAGKGLSKAILATPDIPKKILAEVLGERTFHRNIPKWTLHYDEVQSLKDQYKDAASQYFDFKDKKDSLLKDIFSKEYDVPIDQVKERSKGSFDIRGLYKKVISDPSATSGYSGNFSASNKSNSDMLMNALSGIDKEIKTGELLGDSDILLGRRKRADVFPVSFYQNLQADTEGMVSRVVAKDFHNRYYFNPDGAPREEVISKLKKAIGLDSFSLNSHEKEYMKNRVRNIDQDTPISYGLLDFYTRSHNFNAIPEIYLKGFAKGNTALGESSVIPGERIFIADRLGAYNPSIVEKQLTALHELRHNFQGTKVLDLDRTTFHPINLFTILSKAERLGRVGKQPASFLEKLNESGAYSSYSKDRALTELDADLFSIKGRLYSQELKRNYKKGNKLTDSLKEEIVQKLVSPDEETSKKIFHELQNRYNSGKSIFNKEIMENNPGLFKSILDYLPAGLPFLPIMGRSGKQVPETAPTPIERA